MNIWQLIAIWLHTLAFVIAWGYYGILGRIALPALERSLEEPARTATLVEIERRALPLVLLSIVLFVATGTYLLLIDPHYAGLGHFFANAWSTLMFVKHAVVIVLVGLGIATDMLIRRAGGARDEATRASDLRIVRSCAEGATGVGAVLVLLTVAAQLSA